MISYTFNLLGFFLFQERYQWIDEVFIVLLSAFAFNFLMTKGLKQLHRHFQNVQKIWQAALVEALRRPMSLYIAFSVLCYVTHLVFLNVFGFSFFDLKTTLSIGSALSIAWFLLLWKRALILYFSLHKTHLKGALEAGKIDVINKLGTLFIVFLTLLFILEFTGRNINTLIAFGGVGGLAIAFASQEMISNFFGGLMIYITQPFTVGDWINLPERKVEGHVEEIGWYVTRIRNFEKRPIYIPNSMFSKLVVMTPSRMSHRKFEETLHIRYEDMKVARNIISDLRELLKNHLDVDQILKPAVNLVGFGDFGLKIDLSAYLIDTSGEGFAETREDLLFKIYGIIQEHQAEIVLPLRAYSLYQNP